MSEEIPKYNQPEITIRKPIQTDNILIGQGCDDNGYNHVILIGQNLKADYDYQVKLGGIEFNKEREMSEDEWQELNQEIKKMVAYAFGNYNVIPLENMQKVKDALVFYQYYADAIAQDMKNLNNNGLQACISVLELDAGNRAKEVLEYVES